MSGKATAAVQRPAMSSLLQRILSTVMDWFRNWLDLRSGSSPAPKPSRRTVALESLEPRLLMSADLVGSIAAAPIPDEVLPGDKFNVSVIVRNVGAHTAGLTPVVRLYASNTGQVDSHSIALGESSVKNSIIRPNQSVSVNVTADASRIGDTGNYSLFAVVDATNKVHESNENNNVAVAGKPLHVVWSFGAVPGHSNTGSITLTDDFGTRVTFTMTGAGRGDVVLGEDGFDLHLTGTNTSSVLKITTSGGRGYTTLGDVTVDGSLKQIEASKADLFGDLSIGGTIRSIELRDIEDGAGISIAGTGVPVKLSADEVVGASIHSASAFESISIEEWVPGASGRGVISAPSIGKLTVDGAFGADLDLTGAASGLTLSTVQVEGRITGGLWNIGGSAGQISAKSIEATWQGSFEGSVQKIKTDQNMSGTLATPSIGTIDVGGSMIGAKLLIGATPGGGFGAGNIGELRVGGAINNSSILVGVDPFDGIYGNGNDIVVGGAASRIQQIVVGGKLLGTTSFVAGGFPSYVRINGQTVRSASVPQFHLSVPDTVAPVIAADLFNDTGVSATDRYTRDHSIAGQVTEPGGIATFEIAFDSPNSVYYDILSFMSPDGSFYLDRHLYEQFLGERVADGVHTFYLRAVDVSGNASIASVDFTFDLTVPELPTIELLPTDDTGLAGDRITSKNIVTLTGVAEANVLVILVGTDRTTIADADGRYSFDNIVLADEGGNTFIVELNDAAGNGTAAGADFVLDTGAPEFVLDLLNDTGASEEDGITAIPDVAGNLFDDWGVYSLTVSLNGNQQTQNVSGAGVSLDFLLDASYLEALAGAPLADGPVTIQLEGRDAAGNVRTTQFSYILDRTPPTTPQFDLAAGSDTGAIGDHRTTEAIVSLTGLADFEIDLALNDVPVLATWTGNVFRIDGVALAAGENVLTLRATDPAGNVSTFTRSIFRDEAPVEDGLFPDLAVTSIQTQIVGQDEFGRDLLQVTWTVANQGDAIAQGRHGAWGESVHLSYDDTPWNGDSFLTALKITDPLAPGATQERTVTVAIEPWFTPGYRVYVVTDDEVGFFNESLGYFESFANEVFEKTAGEFNDLLIDDVPNGPVSQLPESGPEITVDGAAVAGSIDAAGQMDIYTFSLGEQTRLYFDSLSADASMTWTIRTLDGNPVFSHNFAASDAFGMGAVNPLMNLSAGDYELVVSNTANATGGYAFRLIDPNLAASDRLVLDGGPLLREVLDRGDMTDIYQFTATAGTHYVAGGPNDWAVDGALYWRMFDPQGNQIWSSTTEPSDEEIFDLTGTYTLMVEGNVERTDAAQYNVYVFTPQDRDIALTFGQFVRGFIDAPGQVNTYHFTLDQATVGFFDAKLESNGPWFDWALEGPDGLVSSGNTRQESDQFGNTEFMNLGAGAYTLRIQGQGDAAGWYTFQLFDVLHEPAPELAIDDVPATGFLNPGFNSTLYRFNGVAGDELTIALSTLDQDWLSYDPARWVLFDAQGTIVSAGSAGTPVDTTLGDSGSYSLLIQGRQYSWFAIDYSLTVASSDEEGVVPIFDLAPESDTGVPGDHRTTLDVVTLTGVAAPNAQLSLAFSPLTTVADASGVFSFFNVVLAVGNNSFTVLSQDAEGNETEFTRTIFREGSPEITTLADLAVLSIDRQVLGANEFGDIDMLVSWVTANQAVHDAHGQAGFWIENLFVSQFDAVPFSGDDIFLGNVFVTEDLAGNSERTHSLNITLPNWIGEQARFYIVVDEGNQVFEKTAGEYNNVTVEDVSSGVPPPPIAPSGSVLDLSGVPTAGYIGMSDGPDIYTFTLTAPTKLLFDALSSDPGVSWELRLAGGPTLYAHGFADSDAFGMGPINGLLNAGPGSYELEIHGPAAMQQFAFRLLDIEAAASHDLVLDGGALLGQTLARGDQTNVYQFHANEGLPYVVGGMADNTVEGALYWRLFDPEGHQIWSGTTEPSDTAITQIAGTYTLVVEGRYGKTDPTRYNVFVFIPGDRFIQLDVGNHVQGFLDGPGQVNTYTFTLDAPTSLFLDGRLDSNGLYFDWVLEGAGGIEGQGTLWQDSANGADPLLHLAAGSYTLKINAQGDASGWYNFKLMDVLHDPAMALTANVPVQPFVYPGFESQLYRFDGTAGSQASISLTSFDPEWYTDVARWTLIDPQGNAIASGLPSAAAAVFDLATSGTWTILVQGRQASWEPLQYTLTLA